MLNIGDFARLGGVSVRMLRHYDGLGLLRPAHVDEWSGRRRYEAEQLTELNRLVALKELGFTLQEVGELLREGVDPAQLRGMLRLRRSELERQVQEDRHRLARVEARLRLIESEHTMSEHEIVVKHVEPLRLAALSEVVPDATRATSGRLIEDLFVRMSVLMDAAGASRTSPVGWYGPEPVTAGEEYEDAADEGPGEALRIHAGFVLPGDVPPGTEVVELPAARVASVIHRGPMADIAGAHQTLARWAEANGHSVGGAQTERHVFLEADGDDQSEWVVEVQLELA